MKKILALILTLALSVSAMLALVSCGDDKDGDEIPPRVKLVDIKLTDENYAFACKKGNTALVTSFNAFLAEIKANGEFDAIINKYFQGQGTKNGYTINNEAVNDENTFVVATNCPFEPFEYIGEDGLAYGVDIEIAALYAAKNNLTLAVKNVPFESVLEQVGADYADIAMAGITITEDRKASYDFTETYYAASQKLIVAYGCTDFDACQTADDVVNVLKGLSGKKLGYQNGTTAGLYITGDADWGFDGFANITAKNYATAQDAVLDLINGNLYGVMVDEAPAAALVKAINNQ